MATGTQLATDSISGSRTASGGSADLKTPAELAGIVAQFAAADGWMDRVRLRVERRWYERLHSSAEYDIWVISWLPGQSTGFHDHGASSGAFVVATGVLEEHRPGERPRVIQPGQPYAFSADYAHDVRNESLAPAISIHAYSPPLSEMNRYELEQDRLVPRQSAAGQTATQIEDWPSPERKTADRNSTSVDHLLSTARARLRRLSPEEARDRAAGRDAVLVDIRPESQRSIEGSIPGALVVERNVLEWRFDPASSARLSIATDHDLQVILFCSEGYTSSLAAAALQDIGLWRATDLVGGFQAWRNAGLPVVQPIESYEI